MDKDISQAVIGRLPRYLRYLGELKDKNVERISSSELSVLMKVTASQIRQDLNNFGGFGQQGYGYNVNYLYEEIGKILGLDKRHNLIIIGADTIVAVDDEILGKPKDDDEAILMLKKLSGREHSVYTGVSFVFMSSDGRVGEHSFFERTG